VILTNSTVANSTGKWQKTRPPTWLVSSKTKFPRSFQEYTNRSGWSREGIGLLLTNLFLMGYEREFIEVHKREIGKNPDWLREGGVFDESPPATYATFLYLLREYMQINKAHLTEKGATLLLEALKQTASPDKVLKPFIMANLLYLFLYSENRNQAELVLLNHPPYYKAETTYADILAMALAKAIEDRKKVEPGWTPSAEMEDIYRVVWESAIIGRETYRERHRFTIIPASPLVQASALLKFAYYCPEFYYSYGLPLVVGLHHNMFLYDTMFEFTNLVMKMPTEVRRRLLGASRIALLAFAVAFPSRVATRAVWRRRYISNPVTVINYYSLHREKEELKCDVSQYSLTQPQQVFKEAYETIPNLFAIDKNGNIDKHLLGRGQFIRDQIIAFFGHPLMRSETTLMGVTNFLIRNAGIFLTDPERFTAQVVSNPNLTPKQRVGLFYLTALYHEGFALPSAEGQGEQGNVTSLAEDLVILRQLSHLSHVVLITNEIVKTSGADVTL